MKVQTPLRSGWGKNRVQWTETTKDSWLCLSVFTCNNLNRPIDFLEIEKIPLPSYCHVPYYFKFQTFYTIIDIKYINIFVFQLHIFLNVPIDISDSRWSYLMEYCGEITWDDFLKNGYVWFLNSRHFYFSFSWNRSHERLCIGYSSFISNRRVRRLLDSSTNVICGALPMARL